MKDREITAVYDERSPDRSEILAELLEHSLRPL
jgi:hypothetical protein